MNAAIPRSRKMMTRSQTAPIPPTSSPLACRSFASCSVCLDRPSYHAAKGAHDLSHTADAHLGLCQTAVTKETNHAPNILEGEPCRCRARRHDRLCGRTNGPRINAAAADAPGAQAGNDEAHEPDEGSLQHHDAGQRRACRAGKEGLNSAIVGAGVGFLSLRTAQGEARMTPLLVL